LLILLPDDGEMVPQADAGARNPAYRLGMAIALTFDVPCPTALGPAAEPNCFALEAFDAPDAPRRATKTLGHDVMLQVLEGVLYVAAGDEESVLMPGDSATVPAGTRLRRWNAGDDHARWVETYSAA
jgi:hypothetical protein